MSEKLPQLSRGLLQVYTGNGKGKTTAAVGLAVRALGQGLRVLLVRLLKPAEPASGEVLLLAKLPGVTILTAGVGVIDGRATPEEVAASVSATFAAAREQVLAGAFDLAIFDEINNAVHRGALPLEALLALIEERPATVELVLTGRHAHPEVLARADLITEMVAQRHPFAAGIGARRGIEY